MAFVFGMPFTSAAQRPMEKEALCLQSEILGKDVAYSIVLPAGYSANNNRYPVVYMLHGIGGDCSTWMEYGHVATVMDNMVKAEQILPFIIVIPDGYLSYYVDSYDGRQPYEEFFIHELKPFIDEHYRTMPDVAHQAVMGFSMGGAGALSLALRNDGVLGSAVALSPSIRTDEQYMLENPQSAWDEQWGKIFGGIGAQGKARITPYYKTHSPLHLVRNSKNSRLKDGGIFIDVGDKERTLCRSNEMLHRLLLEKGFQHYWNVRHGGHDFAVWNAALPSAFSYLSSRFSGQKYEGLDSPRSFMETCLAGKQIYIPEATVWLPSDTSTLYRKYPVVYISGTTGEEQRQCLDTVDELMRQGLLPQIVVAFLNGSFSNEAVLATEKHVRCIRKSQRMRGLILMNGQGRAFFDGLKQENLFAAVVINQGGTVSEKAAISAVEGCERYPKLWIHEPADARSYASWSELHIWLRSNEKEHEYRSSMAKASVQWKEWLLYIVQRIYV